MKRERFEEFGIKGVDLRPVTVSFCTTDFYNAIYRVAVADGTVINFDAEELGAVF